MRKERFKVWIRDIKEFANQDMVKAQVFVNCDGVPIWRDKKDNLHSVSKMVDIVYSIGLKDKNGVEIYESDIVTTDWLGYKHTGEVKFKQCNARYTIGTQDMPCNSTVFCEVIGNVYENKELLC